MTKFIAYYKGTRRHYDSFSNLGVDTKVLELTAQTIEEALREVGEDLANFFGCETDGDIESLQIFEVGSPHQVDITAFKKSYQHTPPPKSVAGSSIFRDIEECRCSDCL